MLGVSYVMTVYVDACALVYFPFHPRSVDRSVDPGTTSKTVARLMYEQISTMFMHLMSNSGGV